MQKMIDEEKADLRRKEIPSIKRMPFTYDIGNITAVPQEPLHQYSSPYKKPKSPFAGLEASSFRLGALHAYFEFTMENPTLSPTFARKVDIGSGRSMMERLPLLSTEFENREAAAVMLELGDRDLTTVTAGELRDRITARYYDKVLPAIDRMLHPHYHKEAQDKSVLSADRTVRSALRIIGQPLSEVGYVTGVTSAFYETLGKSLELAKEARASLVDVQARATKYWGR